jgi:hypothetical protein
LSVFFLYNFIPLHLNLCRRQYLFPSTALELNIFAVGTQLCVDRSIYIAVVNINIERVAMETVQFILVSIVVDVRDVRTSSLSQPSDAILFDYCNFMAIFFRRQQ